MSDEMFDLNISKPKLLRSQKKMCAKCSKIFYSTATGDRPEGCSICSGLDLPARRPLINIFTKKT